MNCFFFHRWIRTEGNWWADMTAIGANVWCREVHNTCYDCGSSIMAIEHNFEYQNPGLGNRHKKPIYRKTRSKRGVAPRKNKRSPTVD